MIILGMTMKIRIECRDYEVMRLPHPLSRVVAVLSTHRDGYFILNPKEALLTIYEAKKVSERILKDFIDRTMNDSLMEGSMTPNAMEFRKHIKIRATPLVPVKDRLEHILVIHIPKELREFEVSDDIGELIWIKGSTITMSAEEFIKRIAWAVIYHGLDLNVLTKLRER